MLPSLMRSILSALLVLALGAAAPAGGAQPPRIVAIGDLHGDFDAYRAILRAARLVDERGRWAGGEAVLVQLGDIVDRGPDSLKIVRHLMRLQREAARARGKVVVVLGNHEAMIMTGDLRYVHPGEYAAFADAQSERRRERAFEANRAAIGASYRRRDPSLAPEAIKKAWLSETPLGMLEHQAAWHPEGEIGRWALRNPAVAQIGDTLFVHGGISPAYAAIPIKEINRRAAAALAARDAEPQSIINDPSGPLWYRGLAGRGAEGGAAPAATREEVNAVLGAYGAGRIVIGHTPVPSGIRLLHDGRLALVDTGITAAYGGVWSYLELAGDRATAHVVPKAAFTGGEWR